MFKKIFKDCFTGKDNKTYDFIRVIGFIVIIFYLFLAFCDIFITRNQLDFISFAMGFGTIITTLATSLWVKKSTEPEPDQNKHDSIDKYKAEDNKKDV
jgi:hypothetical protein